MAKVLLVEDDNNLREIYEARLIAEGYEITAAQNGEEALSVAKQTHPDLIISDVMMPRISGFEMLDILRNTDELKNTKVIMLTALGQSEDRGRADNLGADKYLVKSQVTLEDIVNSAKALLGDTPAAQAERPVEPTTDVTTQPISLPEPVPSVMQSVSPTPAPAAVVATEPPSTDMATPTDTTQPQVSSTADPDEPITATAEEPEAITPDVETATPTVEEHLEAVTAYVEPALPQFEATPDTETTGEAPTAPIASVVPTTVTVADTDPIIPHVSPAAEPLTPSMTPQAAPEQPEPSPIPPVQPSAGTESEVTSAEPSMPLSAEPQSLADEEATIEAQIAAFAGAPVEETVDGPAPDAVIQTPEPAPEEITAADSNDTVLNDAIAKLIAPTDGEKVEAPTFAPLPDPNAPKIISPSPAIDEADEAPLPTTQTPMESVPAESAPTPTETEPPTEPVAEPSSLEISGRKVIKPLSDLESNTTKLDELLAKEEAKEAAEALPTPMVGTAEAPARPAQTPGVDPNNIAL